MANHTPHKPHRTHADEAEDDPEPGMLPVEPDKGPVPSSNPEDTQHDGVVDPEV